MKKFRKKITGILLAVSVAAASVFPIQGTAAQPYSNTPETGHAAANRETTVSANLPADVNSGGLPMAAAYDIDPPVIENFELEESGQTLNQYDTLHFKMSAYDAESGIKSIKVTLGTGFYGVNSVTLHHSGGNLYTGTLPCSDLSYSKNDYYVSHLWVEDNAGNYIDLSTRDADEYRCTFTYQYERVEEAVSLSGLQIQTASSGGDGKVGIGDTVTYTAQLDCEEHITVKRIEMRLKARGNSRKQQSLAMTYDADTLTMTGTYTVTADTYPGEWDLTQIIVYTQNNSHFFYPNEIAPDADLAFTVNNDGYDLAKPVIESITIDKNGQMVKAGDTVAIKIKVTEENPSTWMWVTFYPDSQDAYSFETSLEWEPSTMEYIGEINITRDTFPTKWELSSLKLSDKNGNQTYLSDFWNEWDTTKFPWYYTVDPAGYLNDTKAPVIEDITLDKNGQWVRPGDKIILKVKVNEENPSPETYADFRPQVSNVSSSFRLYLDYHADTGEYIGTIHISDQTYPCEWTLTDLVVSDVRGNKAYAESFLEGWRDTYPWYYRVKAGDTFREDVKDVTISFYGLVKQADGSFQYGLEPFSQTVENVGRRTTLRELGISLPQPMEGLTAVWEYGGLHMREIDEDSELLFEGPEDRTFYIYTRYDKGCANVTLTYMTKDNGIKTAVFPFFTAKETTFQEVLDTFPLPEDARTEGFSGYKLTAPLDGTIQVGNYAYLSAEAEYNNCQVAWHTRYFDENGNEKSDIISASYEKGTAVNEALAALKAPETTGEAGAEPTGFEAWILTEVPGEDILSQPMTDLYVTAVYRGKTTVDVAYTYRGEDGALTCGGGLMLMDGENLSDAAILGEATNAFKNVNHLEGLLLQEWSGNTETDLGRYKKASFRALYRNCAVILKYPDGACQYIVVPKGSPFTLPTENETYTDILWEGCAAGETVTITADREFLAADAKPKDSSADKPSGTKPSMDDIQKIIDEINHTENGGTVRVDMKKATVVPKEVLEAIQGKEVNIVLDMGAYCWSIGGTDVLASNLKDTDLEVTIGTNAIPPALVDSLAEGKPSTRLSLTHNGEFGFRADLTLNLGSGHAGCTGNLYYYDSSGKLVYRNAGEIGADGTISLSFSHASDYVIIIDRAPAGNENNGSGSEEQKENDGSEEREENGGSEEREENGGSEDLGVSPPADQSNSQRQTAPDGNNGDRNGSGADTGRPKSPKTGEF